MKHKIGYFETIQNIFLKKAARKSCPLDKPVSNSNRESLTIYLATLTTNTSVTF